MRFPGALNEHIIGVSLKEAVRRAIVEVRRQRFIFEAREKTTEYKDRQDFVTTADVAAQELYAKLLQEHFPTYGIVAEEGNLAVSCLEVDDDIWLTVDPLDGTKAYIRKQSHGIGTMISLIRNGKIIAAYVGDVMTQELYGYRPGSNSVWRISQLEHWEKLEVDPIHRLANQYILLRDAPDLHSETVQRLVRSPQRGGLCDGLESTGGSFGIGMARLWKGEVGAAVLRPTAQTPWDLYPVLGISQQLGFAFLEIFDDSKPTFRPYEFPVSKEIFRTEREILVVHHSRIPEVESWAHR